jgi:FtsH-binding integral membrane protein
MPSKLELSAFRLARGRPWAVVPLVVALLLLDAVPALEGTPLLALTVVIAFFAGEGFSRWLGRKELEALGQVSALVATLMLLLAFCYRRELSQPLLLLITAGVMVSLLFVVLGLIAEVSKRGLKGLGDFLLMTGLGLVLGAVLVGVLFLRPGPLGGEGAGWPGSSGTAAP